MEGLRLPLLRKDHYYKLNTYVRNILWDGTAFAGRSCARSVYWSMHICGAIPVH